MTGKIVRDFERIVINFFYACFDAYRYYGLATDT